MSEEGKEKQVDGGEVILSILTEVSLNDLAGLGNGDVPRQQAVHHSHVSLALCALMQLIL